MNRSKRSWVMAPAALALALVLSAGLGHAQVGKSLGVLDANLASEKELQSAPHVTPAVAKAIVAGRPYANVDALNRVLTKSLAPAQVAEVYGKLFVPLNLNTASREEILLIPRVGDRMLREFLEYRPYKALSQFHREIDKYVDDNELARLEQYVFVPIDLNAATDADILTIPGVGQRMLHEFKEYRPYKSMEQFRREIGKYVDKTELARLERYVTIN
jgi:DNA uptake protein ComE-like DNA-binding protein